MSQRKKVSIFIFSFLCSSLVLNVIVILIFEKSLKMGFPKVKTVNTISIKYTKGEREESRYEEIIENILKVSVDGIAEICEWDQKDLF